MKTFRAFRQASYSGIASVVAEATGRGYTAADAQWCNLGQGQPEIGALAGAPAPLDAIEVAPTDRSYGPLGGTQALRHCVAEYYNRLYRAGQRSQYRAENVAIAAGGRLALTRLLAALGETRLGYRTPDYAGYSEMLALQAHRIACIAARTTAEDRFVVPPARFAAWVADEQLGAVLISNPCNPTGQLVAGDDLASYVRTARSRDCALLLDEFYSHYIYGADGSPAAQPVSAARYVDDVNGDPVVIVDGLTKNFRCPGWRVAWTIGPAEIIEQVVRASSAIDGGPPTVMQAAAERLLEPARADEETTAVRTAFAHKRTILLDGLTRLGIRVPCPPRGSFYVWGDVSALPAPLDTSDGFFRAAVDQRIVVVPGRFFDVDPGNRGERDRDYERWVRFSFGPSEETLRLALSRLAQLRA